MVHLHLLPEYKDDRGVLTPMDFHEFPFEPKRIFYVYDVPKDTVRAEHTHKTASVALVCMNGSFLVECEQKGNVMQVLLSHPRECLEIPPGVWHRIVSKSDNSILMVVASEPYNKDEYEAE